LFSSLQANREEFRACRSRRFCHRPPAPIKRNRFSLPRKPESAGSPFLQEFLSFPLPPIFFPARDFHPSLLSETPLQFIAAGLILSNPISNGGALKNFYSPKAFVDGFFREKDQERVFFRFSFAHPDNGNSFSRGSHPKCILWGSGLRECIKEGSK